MARQGMRHVEMTEVTKLRSDEAELSNLRETQYTFAKLLHDCELWIRIDLWTREVR
jgi:hypothetical protein